MEKHDLFKKDETIIRVLEQKEDAILTISCTKQIMPKWMKQTELNDYLSCTEADLISATGMQLESLDTLDANRKKFAYEHYTLIAGILPFIGDEKQRSYTINKIAEEKGISKQTIRHYLCLYLTYQSIAALAPKQKAKKETLSQDEKNMRWALNKFYYTKNKNSLQTAYILMLKTKYCDATGNLFTEYPSIHQFKYYYRKHNKLQTSYISRDGIKNYQRNHRPLLGNGVQEFAPAVGVGMLDTTICDIYLINEAGSLVGRPILTACIDAYSGLCCGYSLLWEGGVYSLKNLMANVIADKVEWCKNFGISINREMWNCDKLPAMLVADMGTEYKSETFEQITELGVTLVNLPPWRPELKGAVEKFFDLLQNSYKKHLKGKGVIEVDYRERGSHDYRKDACLTMGDFEKIVLHCILYYNSKRILERFPYTEEMIAEKVQPYASDIWNYGVQQAGANLIAVDYERLMLTLLPRTLGKFARNGLKVNKLRYKHEDYTEQYLKGGVVTVAYNPDDVSEIWLLDNGEYIRFTLIEIRFQGKTLSEVEAMQADQKDMVKELVNENLQAQIQLTEQINTIANTASVCGAADIKGIRNTRNRERNKAHKDYMKGRGIYA